MAKLVRCFFGRQIYSDRVDLPAKYTISDLESCSEQLEKINLELASIVREKYSGSTDVASYDPADKTKVLSLFEKQKALQTRSKQISEILRNNTVTQATLENLQITSDLAKQIQRNTVALQNAMQNFNPHEIAQNSEDYEEQITGAQDIIQLSSFTGTGIDTKEFEASADLEKMLQQMDQKPPVPADHLPIKPSNTEKHRPRVPAAAETSQSGNRSKSSVTPKRSSTAQKKPEKKPAIPLSQ